MKPSGLAPCIKQRISCLASSGSTCNNAIAWNALSQNHWNGYVVGEGHTKSYRCPAHAEIPRWRLPSRTRRASAATVSQSVRMTADYPVNGAPNPDSFFRAGDRLVAAEGPRYPEGRDAFAARIPSPGDVSR